MNVKDIGFYVNADIVHTWDNPLQVYELTWLFEVTVDNMDRSKHPALYDIKLYLDRDMVKDLRGRALKVLADNLKSKLEEERKGLDL